MTGRDRPSPWGALAYGTRGVGYGTRKGGLGHRKKSFYFTAVNKNGF